MKEIASNEFYTISVDEDKNRLKAKLKGSWTRPEQAPYWLDDLIKAFQWLSPGFDALIDETEMGAVLLTDFMERAHKLALRGQIGKLARVHNRESLAKIQVEQTSMKTGFDKVSQTFMSVSEAEAWLNGE